MLAQENKSGIEHAVYYLSEKFLPYKANYNLVEKTFLAIIWVTKKLRHYFQSYKIQAVLKYDPLKYLQETPSLTGKLARWLVLLIEFDIDYLSKKVIKGRAVAEFLAQNLMDDDHEWELEFPNEHLGVIEVQGWCMYFDEADNNKRASI